MTTPTRCGSSHLMTGLLTWRNPQGKEENWVGRRQTIDSMWKHVGKVVSTEIAVGLLAITSTIETVAYSVLSLLTLPLYPVTNRPCKFFAKSLQSSSYTILWALKNLFANPYMKNMVTQESLVRFTGLSIFCRKEDVVYGTNWRNQLSQSRNRQRRIDIPDPRRQRPRVRPEHPPAPKGLSPEQIIDQGAKYIVNELLKDAKNEFVEDFKAWDVETIKLVTEMALFLYVGGTKRVKEIPLFFKPETRQSLLALRETLNNKEELMQFIDLVTNPPDSLEKASQSQTSKKAYTTFNSIVQGELQGSIFVTHCFQKAVQHLEAEQA